jgi:hypothetical protein
VLVRMRLARYFLDAGVERMLDFGKEYDLPPVVAQSLVATGAAVMVAVEEFTAIVGAPEIRPMRAPETKQGRR